ncbi:hypothetical protein JAAARDRAFT_209038 [Jaapia argillacea MUCL 33604]|uniref:CS domain-containing protein n=1 Tax=Jaapia argillacea MUCL 33604 TaxID=933084 RepID=A0A067PIT7_9AGAM|nr:hypothetical protein JAAARDRAFT_209038 [Jaapia argillacea MUCL 33604]
MVAHPEVLWAQRSSDKDETKNIVYVTIHLPDVIPSSLDYKLTPTTISLTATAGNAAKGIAEKDYAFSFDLYGEVVPEKSTKRLNSRDLLLVLRKKDLTLAYWPRLTKEKIKTPFLKTDFSKWVDEDEQDGEEVKLDDDDMMGGMPGGGMGGMPGMGGMGGMPGMGGMGGMGGMDMEALMAQMGGAGGLGNLGGGSGGAEEAEDDSDDDGPPPLEESEPKTA